MPCNVFYVLYIRRFRPDTAFACVTHVVRIVTALTCGARRFSLAISEYAQNTSKIWWGTDIEDFGVRKTYVRRQKLKSVTSA